MADPKKASIPAWQREAQPKSTVEEPVYGQPQSVQPPPATTDDLVHSQPETSKSTTLNSPVNIDDPVYSQADAKNSTASPSTANADDPVYSQAEPNKNLVSVAPTNIDDPVYGQPHALQQADFAAFRQQYKPIQEVSRPSPPQQSAPPIITYPEFLVDAHKPPPLITPTRIVNTLYAAGAVVALAYGASRWLVNPIVESLSSSRHDFLTHSQSKIDDLNERLSKVVSKLPAANDPAKPADELEEVESVIGDPTELYSRDTGTQTSPTPTRRSSAESTPASSQKDAVTYQTTGLSILKSHVEELTTGAETARESQRETQDSVNKLRHYLDTLQYSSAGINVWASSEDAIGMKASILAGGEGDAIDELKKQIRGVKGVLLSARRFPAVGGHG